MNLLRAALLMAFRISPETRMDRLVRAIDQADTAKSRKQAASIRLAAIVDDVAERLR